MGAWAFQRLQPTLARRQSLTLGIVKRCVRCASTRHPCKASGNVASERWRRSLACSLGVLRRNRDSKRHVGDCDVRAAGNSQNWRVWQPSNMQAIATTMFRVLPITLSVLWMIGWLVCFGTSGNRRECVVASGRKYNQTLGSTSAMLCSMAQLAQATAMLSDA